VFSPRVRMIEGVEEMPYGESDKVNRRKLVATIELIETKPGCNRGNPNKTLLLARGSKIQSGYIAL